MRKLLAEDGLSLAPEQTGGGGAMDNIRDMRWKNVRQMLSMLRKQQIDPRAVRIHIDGSDEAEVRDFLSVVRESPEELRGFILRASKDVRARIDEVMKKHRTDERGTKDTRREAEWEARNKADTKRGAKTWRVETASPKAADEGRSIFDDDVDWPTLDPDQMNRRREAAAARAHPVPTPTPAAPKRSWKEKLLGWTGLF